jgi:exonuclease SbcC
MQVLTIRGCNLASLAGEFEIDLTAEPLAGAGLFAITGDTGSGKSTLLDALCLALYGTFPRLRDAGREDVPDSSGQTVSVSDPANILRRGTGRGWAEVDFVANDAVSYRARWEVYRARDRFNGNLQKAQRTLVRIDDGSVVANSVRTVDAEIPRLTGLTFDQFRRTVLLAQGDFDAFLMADNAERGDLLEKITGTEIYAEISRRVYSGSPLNEPNVTV